MAQGKYVGVTSTVTSLISDAGSIVEELKDEMSEWRDNLEEKFSATEKYERVNEAADALENSDVTGKAEELIEALEEATKGKPYKPGCAPHVVGTACAVCKWDGKAQKRSGNKQTAKLYDPPVDKRGNYEQAFSGKKTYLHERYYGAVGCQVWCLDVKAPASEHAQVKQEAEEAVAKALAENALLNKPYVPDERKPVAEILPITSLLGLADAEVRYSEFQAYKGRSISRATRLSNATSGGKAAIEVVREALDAYDGADDRIDEITTALDEFESALDECENVDFPGMYG